jgi:UDP-N-acetylmuramoylalanine--D-glutamate ligase
MDLSGSNVLVMGLGRFGGGLGVTRWLCDQGARVLVTDLDAAERLAEPLAQLRPLVDAGQVSLRLAEHRESDFTSADLVVANPAVPRPWGNPYLRAAWAAHVPITTEIRLAAERLDRRRTIGITGSAGKSTTSAMIHHVLDRLTGRAHLGGNIGGSLLGSLEAIRPADWVVLELSSAMLWWLGDAVGDPSQHGWSPHVAVVTNVRPNHLDWHGDFHHYTESKRSILAHQKPGDAAITVVHPHDPSAEWQEAAGVERMLLEPEDAAFDQALHLAIPGAHNRLNARTAIRAVQAAMQDDTQTTLARAMEAIGSFPGLPHRLQLVHVHDGMRFFNDSKSTTPDATILAVDAFDDPAAVHLLAGGYDKGSDLAPIASLADRLGGLYAIGVTGPRLVAMNSKAIWCETLERAVNQALARMRRGEVLLLSPGCASWDQFTNYEERGETFARLVKTQTALASSSTAGAPL